MLSREQCEKYNTFVQIYQADVYPLIASELVRELPSYKNVLDMGSGPGFLTKALASRLPSAQLTAFDCNSAMLSLARRNNPEAENITYVLGDVHATGLPRQSFDLIVSYSCLHHWQQPVEAVRELASLLRPGSALVVIDTYQDVAAQLIKDLRPAVTEDDLWYFVEKTLSESLSLQEMNLIAKTSQLGNLTVAPFVFSEEVIVENIDLLASGRFLASQVEATLYCLRYSAP
jgi:ubiquinone/menaquinone biosynthesis C-methylase UbiE